MSLINQVLNQLEQRGANAAPDQTQIRAVPAHPKRAWVMPLLLGTGVVIVVSAGAWLWAQKTGRAEQDVHGKIAAAPPVAAVDPVAPDTSGPATRLSYELSVLPLPESLRNEPSPAPQKTSSLTLVANMAAEPQPVPKQKKPSSRQVLTRKEPPMPLKQVSPKQRADAEYRKGVQAQQQGKIPEAMAAYEAALKDDEQHEGARLAMAAMLQVNGLQAAAERTLEAGLRFKPVHLSYAMALARMQLEREQLELAVATLQAYLSAAERNADYQSFYAALLQRQARHKEALNHYQIALQISPRNGVWRVGYAISLQALDRVEDAKQAYKQALATRTLSPELTAFVQQKLAGL